MSLWIKCAAEARRTCPRKGCADCAAAHLGAVGALCIVAGQSLENRADQCAAQSSDLGVRRARRSIGAAQPRRGRRRGSR